MGCDRFSYSHYDVAQFLDPIHGYVWIEGMKALQFTAFVLFPSALGGIFLSFIYPKPDWKGDMP